MNIFALLQIHHFCHFSKESTRYMKLKLYFRKYSFDKKFPVMEIRIRRVYIYFKVLIFQIFPIQTQTKIFANNEIAARTLKISHESST